MKMSVRRPVRTSCFVPTILFLAPVIPSSESNFTVQKVTFPEYGKSFFLEINIWRREAWMMRGSFYLRFVCFLFSSCDDVSTDCVDCHVGVPQCQVFTDKTGRLANQCSGWLFKVFWRVLVNKGLIIMVKEAKVHRATLPLLFIVCPATLTAPQNAGVRLWRIYWRAMLGNNDQPISKDDYNGCTRGQWWVFYFLYLQEM